MYIEAYIKHKLYLNHSENDYRSIWFACFIPVVINLDFHKVISDQKRTRCHENTETITISTELTYRG
jgi:hypothetical protein